MSKTTPCFLIIQIRRQIFYKTWLLYFKQNENIFRDVYKKITTHIFQNPRFLFVACSRLIFIRFKGLQSFPRGQFSRRNVSHKETDLNIDPAVSRSVWPVNARILPLEIFKALPLMTEQKITRVVLGFSIKRVDTFIIFHAI